MPCSTPPARPSGRWAQPYGWWQWGTTAWLTWTAWRRRLTRPSASCRSSWSTAKWGPCSRWPRWPGSYAGGAPSAVLHTDAVQAVPWFDVAELGAGADMVSISGHKFGGPQGVGALAFRRPVKVEPVLYGGPQERERRAGTHNVAGIVGMAAALETTAAERTGAYKRVGDLRGRLAGGLLGSVPGAHETAAGRHRAPGHCHLLIDGVESEALLVVLDERGVAASAGSACASGAMEPSHVLTAMGYPPSRALGALRLTLGHTTTEADVDLALRVVPAAVARLRGEGYPGVAGLAPATSLATSLADGLAAPEGR